MLLVATTSSGLAKVAYLATGEKKIALPPTKNQEFKVKNRRKIVEEAQQAEHLLCC